MHGSEYKRERILKNKTGKVDLFGKKSDIEENDAKRRLEAALQCGTLASKHLV